MAEEGVCPALVQVCAGNVFAKKSRTIEAIAFLIRDDELFKT
jgi:hypothetical protein